MKPPTPNGVLRVDKPAGPTSHDVVQDVRRLLGVRRVGHTGTLDPFATGLLLLCVGRATRIAQYLSAQPKGYRAVARLGVATDSGDAEGTPSDEDPGWKELDRAALERVLKSFEGEGEQIPPALSAKKVGGEPAHRRVRRGEEVDLPAIPITIHSIELVDLEGPEATFDLRCSSGTYVRALARDLGEKLGVGAHLTALRRTSIGPIGLEGAATPDRWRERDVVEAAWLRPAEALGHLEQIRVSEREAHLLGNGRPIEAGDHGRGHGDGELVALVRGGELVAVGMRERQHIRPRKVFLG